MIVLSALPVRLVLVCLLLSLLRGCWTVMGLLYVSSNPNPNPNSNLPLFLPLMTYQMIVTACRVVKVIVVCLLPQTTPMMTWR